MEKDNIKISFGVIVLNGMPYVKYLLRQLYPHAHEIIIVEGASKNADEVSTSDGHSTDGTVEAINEFKSNEDPEMKVKLISKNGFWSEKDEQSQAYAKVATGNYLWQVDIDEFYTHEDIIKVKTLLGEHSEIDTVSFKMITFWGGINYTTDGWYLMRGKDEFHRLFRWNKNYDYSTHRPPTVLDENGIDLRDKNWMRGNELKNKYGIQLFHYSLVFPKQVEGKSKYYEKVFNKGFLNWMENSYKHLRNPFRTHNKFEYPSWLSRYSGTHPEQIKELFKDITAGKVEVTLRENSDVEKIIDTLHYKIGKVIVYLGYYPYSLFIKLLSITVKIYHIFKKPN